MKARASISIATRLDALAEPVRLRVLRLLEREELSVGEVASVVQLPQSTVSRHLKVLADAGWLIKRAEGTATLYRLVLDDLDPAGRSLWLAVRDTLGQTPDLAEDDRRLTAVLVERRADSQQFFGRVAGQWDDLRSELFGQRFMLPALLTLLPRDWVVADVGCGTGNVAELLAPHVRQVIAVDQSGPMLQAARKRLARTPNVTFVRGDAEALPVDDTSVDAAVCMLVLHHLADPASAMRELARILRPGGIALVVDMLEHDRESYRHTMGHRWLGFSADQVAELARSAGLEQVSIQTIPSTPEARGPGLFACSAVAPGHT